MSSQDPRAVRGTTPTPWPRELARNAAFMEELREEVLERLGIHFASEDLPRAEIERRVALALQASSPVALDRLVSDLPPVAADVDADATALIAVDPAPERGVLAAFMGGNSRRGAWVVPRHLKVFAVMGGAELDMRRARFAPGVTEIEVLSILGGVQILVPPGVRVEMLAVAAMGGVEANVADVPPSEEGAPVLRISGLAVLGGVEAKAKRPNTKRLKRFAGLLAAARKKAR
jgi:hypothetical protein